MKDLLLSTSNVILGGSSIHRPTTSKSNAELITSLHANFTDHSTVTNGEANGDSHSTNLSYRSWTKQSGDTIEIPSIEWGENALQEEREQYDITAKLFYLPGSSTKARAQQTRRALGLVLKELNMPSIDLLIVSFPGIYFDEEESCPNKLQTRGPVEADPEPLEIQLETWRTLEQLQGEGLVLRLGIAEFGEDRLAAFLGQAKVRPSVDQINLRDCCSVPRDLMALAKKEGLELLVHNDCSNILPRGAVRELLGPSGAGVLAESPQTGEKRKASHEDDYRNGNTDEALKGEVQPQWVIKYTAVVKNRGVVENKGYFAVAELLD